MNRLQVGITPLYKHLKSAANLYSSATIILKGGESVSLNNHFYAPASTDFEAYIGNCPDIPDDQRGP